MTHYTYSREEELKLRDKSRDIRARLEAGFSHVYVQGEDIWCCSLCESLILGNRWKEHLEKAHV